MSNIHLPIAELKPALAGLGKIISKRATLPILGMLKLERTKDGWITLTSTDLDVFITVRLEQPASGEPTCLLIPYEDVTRITKRCGKDDILVVEKTTEDKAVIKFPIGNQTVEEHVESLAVEDFPPIPRIKEEPVPLNDAVRASLHQAMECSSTDETRVIINGIYLDVSDAKCHQLVATDGRHLYSSNSFNLPLKKSVLIPNHRFLGWKEFNSDGEWQLRVQESVKDETQWLQISSRRWRFIIKQIDGHYCNWRQVIPKENGFKREIVFKDVHAVIATIQRMPDSDKINHGISVEAVEGKVFLASNSTDCPVRVEIPSATTTGDSGRICVNRNYLIRALQFGMGRLQAGDELSPIRLSNDEGRQLIIMVIRTSVPPPTATVPESNGAIAISSETSSQPQPERTTQMQATTNGNGANGHEQQVEKPALELAVEQIEAAKASLRSARESVNTLLDTLKQAQREQKSTHKEVQSVRTTLEKLQAVRF